jgi:hypothetical protein
MLDDPDRWLCGVATIFGEACPNDGRIWTAAMFQRWLDLEMAVDLRIDHGPLITGRGVIANLGTVGHFTVIKQPVYGLLCIAQVARDQWSWGDALLHDIGRMLEQRWLPPGWGLSIGAHTDGETVLPYEISLTRSPAVPDALVLAVGPDSIDTYELLTGIELAAASPGLQPHRGTKGEQPDPLPAATRSAPANRGEAALNASEGHLTVHIQG